MKQIQKKELLVPVIERLIREFEKRELYYTFLRMKTFILLGIL